MAEPVEKDVYTIADVEACLKGTGWKVQGLINTGRILPIAGTDGQLFNKSDFSLFLDWCRWRIETNRKLREAHARRKSGLPKETENVTQFRQTPGFVYLIECGGVFKIGKTVNPNIRLMYFGVILPFEPRLIHAIASDDYTRAEAQMHRRFKSKRTRGEWFALSADEVEEFKSIVRL